MITISLLLLPGLLRGMYEISRIMSLRDSHIRILVILKIKTNSFIAIPCNVLLSVKTVTSSLNLVLARYTSPFLIN